MLNGKKLKFELEPAILESEFEKNVFSIILEGVERNMVSVEIINFLSIEIQNQKSASY